MLAVVVVVVMEQVHKALADMVVAQEALLTLVQTHQYQQLQIQVAVVVLLVMVDIIIQAVTAAQV
jgi:hypothetical protein